jgi:polar amino acid transport system substrate-binding protein
MFLGLAAQIDGHEQDPEARPKLLFASIDAEPSSILLGRILSAAYGYLGYELTIISLPARRALMQANDGGYDGDLARMGNIGDQYPNLLAVPTPVIEFAAVAFTIGVTRDIEDWSSLSGLRIGIMRGMLFAEQGTLGLNPIELDNMESLFSALAKDRLDVVIAIRESGLLISQWLLPDAGIHPVGEILFQGSMHHFLHKSHADLVPQIDAILRQMTARGEIEQMHQEYLHGR